MSKEIINQGRHKRQVEGNYKMMGYSIIGFTICFIFILISSL